MATITRNTEFARERRLGARTGKASHPGHSNCWQRHPTCPALGTDGSGESEPKSEVSQGRSGHHCADGLRTGPQLLWQADLWQPNSLRNPCRCKLGLYPNRDFVNVDRVDSLGESHRWPSTWQHGTSTQKLSLASFPREG